MPQAALGGGRRVNILRFDPFDHYALAIREAAVAQSFAQTFVGVFQLDVFADDADADFAGGMLERLEHGQPAAQIARRSFETQQAKNLFVESFGRESHGDFVNVGDVRRGNDAGFGDVAEERDFRFQIGGQRAVAAANQHVRLNSDAEKFFHAVLRGFGFQFARGVDEWHQREVHENNIFRTELEAHLADGFQEWERLDVADGAADFDQDDVHAFGDFAECGFNFIGDVRDDLHGLAKIIAAAFFGDDGFVEAAGGPVVVAR